MYQVVLSIFFLLIYLVLEAVASYFSVTLP